MIINTHNTQILIINLPNNTVPLLNIVKNQIFHPVYTFKNFSTSSSVSQPAARPSSTSAMAPDF